MNRNQQQALANLQASNARDRADRAMERALDPTNTTADTMHALQGVASAKHQAERAERQG